MVILASSSKEETKEKIKKRTLELFELIPKMEEPELPHGVALSKSEIREDHEYWMKRVMGS